MKISDYVFATARRALYIAAAADAISLLALAGSIFPNHVHDNNIGDLVMLAAPVFILVDLRRELSWMVDTWMFLPITALLLLPWYWVWTFLLFLLLGTGRTRIASNQTVDADARKDSARGSP